MKLSTGSDVTICVRERGFNSHHKHTDKCPVKQTGNLETNAIRLSNKIEQLLFSSLQIRAKQNRLSTKDNFECSLKQIYPCSRLLLVRQMCSLFRKPQYWSLSSTMKKNKFVSTHNRRISRSDIWDQIPLCSRPYLSHLVNEKPAAS